MYENVFSNRKAKQTFEKFYGILEATADGATCGANQRPEKPTARGRDYVIVKPGLPPTQNLPRRLTPGQARGCSSLSCALCLVVWPSQAIWQHPDLHYRLSDPRDDDGSRRRGQNPRPVRADPRDPRAGLTTPQGLRSTKLTVRAMNEGRVSVFTIALEGERVSALGRPFTTNSNSRRILKRYNREIKILLSFGALWCVNGVKHLSFVSPPGPYCNKQEESPGVVSRD
ncbi:hypothetical protein EGW08_007280 [Elysia chlorotica]|uniref:Uncharacterized protein n=1 Tax=Elysia chlorotica TaxID=188477 RepID=A0A3S1C7E7_ELYCH|nr:hypothetical protein EGW08_007280 [Elysia chlorotica]